MSNTNNESEERYRILFDQITEAIVLIDQTTGMILDINSAAINILGYSKAEFIKMNIADLEVKASQDQAIKYLSETSSINKEIFETQLKNRNGKLITVLVNTRIIQFQGKPVIQSVWKDITEDKQTKEKLRESESHYRTLFENIDSGVAVYEVIDGGNDFIFKDFNHAGELIDHDQRERLIGKSIFKVRPGIEKFGLIEVFRKVWQTGQPCHHPVTLYKDERLTNWYENYVFRISPNEIAAVFKDITDRKQIEEELRYKNKILARTEHIAHIGSWEWKIESDTVTWSDELFHIFQMDPAEGAPSFANHGFLCDAEDMEKLKVLVDKAVKYGNSYEIELHAIRKDGNVRICIARGLAELDCDGKVRRLYGSLQDITERKQIEEHLQNSQKLESLGILAGGIAHDFNNLLGGIYGLIDIVAEAIDDKVILDYLNKALGTINRARNLTRQLLTFAKGGVPIKRIDKLFPFIQETTQFALSGSSILCNFDIPDDLWMGEFDRNQMGQVIDNIVINAKQAMPDGGIIEVKAENLVITDKSHPILSTGNYVKISIKDHGQGISKEVLPYIFDPFFTTKTKGHGLGLATSYSIIKRHNGCIDVESDIDKGSVFNIYIPASPNSPMNKEKKTVNVHKGTGTIIVMDDEEVMRENITDMLKIFGYSVVSTKTGLEALEVFRSHKTQGNGIVGIIVDLTIPGGMGGKELINEIRKIDKTIPVLVVSGYAEDPIIANPAEFGFTASISKPFSKIELMEILEKHINVT